MISMLTKLFISGSARELKVGGGDDGDPRSCNLFKRATGQQLASFDPIVWLAYTDLIYFFHPTLG